MASVAQHCPAEVSQDSFLLILFSLCDPLKLMPSVIFRIIHLCDEMSYDEGNIYQLGWLCRGS